MNENYWFLWILLASTLIAQAQQRSKGIYVIDAETQKPIPFVAVKNCRSNEGSYTNRSGRFELLEFRQSDTLCIKHLGYEAKKIRIDQLKDTVVALHQLPVELDEVVINTKRLHPKTTVLGYANKSKILTWYMQPQMEFAVLLKYHKALTKATIKEIQIPINTKQLGAKREKKRKFRTAFRVQVYENNDGIPGKSLLQQPPMIICNEKSANLLKIQLQEPFPQFGAEGVFIGVEMLGAIDDAGTVRYQDRGRQILPGLRFTRKNKRRLSTKSYVKYPFLENTWKSIASLTHFEDKGYKLAASIVVVYDRK